MEWASWYYEEAELLDQGRWQAWLERFHPDARYEVWLTEVRFHEPQGEQLTYHPLIADDRLALGIRVQRLLDGLAWSERPRHLTTRLVGNLMAEPLASGRWRVKSTVLLWQWSVSQGRDGVLGFRRTDELAQADGKWQITHRRVELGSDQVTEGALSLLL
jgi:3-phenylpropionate/cinnamic acid dioxygenase small subunit